MAKVSPAPGKVAQDYFSYYIVGLPSAKLRSRPVQAFAFGIALLYGRRGNESGRKENGREKARRPADRQRH